MATGIKSSITYSRNKFFDFLPQININSFFINPTDKTEIKNIILSLDPLKSIGPNSISTKIMKLLSNDISTQFAELFNLPFYEGVFPSILKTCKVIPIYRKDSQLNCSSYRPISLLSNIDKILVRIMYNRLYKFLETNNLICSLQFGFRQKHSISHALIHLADKIREQLGKANFACGIFVDFQKAFETVDHKILIQKLNYYGIRGIASNWFSSYLQNRAQLVSINGFDSNVNAICCGVTQGSILGLLLFLIYINNLHFAIKYCKVYHFTDDTNLLNFNNSIKTINKRVSHDLKYLPYWLNANKICLNVSKTEAVLFKSIRKQTDATLKLKLNGKRLDTTNSVKYLGIKIDENLNWHEQINNVAVKLNRANTMLSKVKHFVHKKTLKSICHAIFESHLFYSCLVWAQNINSIKRLYILQKKSLWLMYFLNRNAHTTPLFKDSNILKFPDKIAPENYILIKNYFSQTLRTPFKNWFTLSTDSHTHNTRRSNLGCLKIPPHKTKIYGRQSVNISAIYTWNYLQSHHKNRMFHQLSLARLKKLIMQYYFSNYD